MKNTAAAIALNKKSSYILIFFIASAALLYVYFANVAVRTVTQLEKSKQDIQVLNVKVSELESKRFALENNVSAEKAKSLGFKEVNNPIFVMKSAKKGGLSLNKISN